MSGRPSAALQSAGVDHNPPDQFAQVEWDGRVPPGVAAPPCLPRTASSCHNENWIGMLLETRGLSQVGIARLYPFVGATGW